MSVGIVMGSQTKPLEDLTLEELIYEIRMGARGEIGFADSLAEAEILRRFAGMVQENKQMTTPNITHRDSTDHGWLEWYGRKMHGYFGWIVTNKEDDTDRYYVIAKDEGAAIARVLEEDMATTGGVWSDPEFCAKDAIVARRMEELDGVPFVDIHWLIAHRRIVGECDVCSTEIVNMIGLRTFGTLAYCSRDCYATRDGEPEDSVRHDCLYVSREH